MSIQLRLDQMSLAEKLEAMELLWADLSRFPTNLPTPEWHRDVLQKRKRLADEGQLRFLDCETAFADLKADLRENPPS